MARIVIELDPAGSALELEALSLLNAAPERDRESLARLALAVGLRNMLGGQMASGMHMGAFPAMMGHGLMAGAPSSPVTGTHEREPEAERKPNPETPRERPPVEPVRETPASEAANESRETTKHGNNLRAGFRGMFGRS